MSFVSLASITLENEPEIKCRAGSESLDTCHDIRTAGGNQEVKTIVTLNGDSIHGSIFALLPLTWRFDRSKFALINTFKEEYVGATGDEDAGDDEDGGKDELYMDGLLIVSFASSFTALVIDWRV